MYERDTIAAIATPPGHGGVAVIRVSGPLAEGIARKVFIPARQRDSLASHHLYFGRIIDPEENLTLDQGLVVVMRAPRSYTGEHVVEIHCHGGNFLSRRVLAVVLRQGARLATPGEFTKRAFLNNRLDLSQAEAVLDLIQARSDCGLNLAWEQLSGRLVEAYAAVRERLVSMTAYVEAFIDFPEDDLPEHTRQELQEELGALVREIASLGATFARGKVYREGLRTAIIGKPNVGKSSLLNLLAGTERAIVTPVPGTTRDVLEETVVVNGIPLVVWDTAGLRHTTDEVERIGVDRAKAGIAAADLVLAVFDASRPFDGEDEEVLAAVAQKMAILVLNKVDLPMVITEEALTQRLPFPPPVSVSAKHGTGIEELGRKLETVLLDSEQTLSYSREPQAVISNVRHRDALAKAEHSLRQVRQGFGDGLPLDLIAVDLHSALDHIGEITGHVTSEDILDRIFRDFCIGK